MESSIPRECKLLDNADSSRLPTPRKCRLLENVDSSRLPTPRKCSRCRFLESRLLESSKVLPVPIPRGSDSSSPRKYKLLESAYSPRVPTPRKCRLGFIKLFSFDICRSSAFSHPDQRRKDLKIECRVYFPPLFLLDSKCASSELLD
jgi:hypothetical protein